MLFKHGRPTTRDKCIKKPVFPNYAWGFIKSLLLVTFTSKPAK
jgi:hypothetical protein